MDTSPNQFTQSPTGSQAAPLGRRLHASTYVVLLLMAAVLFLLNVQGQFMPYIHFGGLEQYRIEFALLERMEHGWPLPYLEQNAWRNRGV
jgi:hypothetical protein